MASQNVNPMASAASDSKMAEAHGAARKDSHSVTKRQENDT